MFIIPILPKTMPVITALNKGEKPDVPDDEQYYSFVYHDDDRPGEVVPSEMVGPVLESRDYVVMEFPMIIPNLDGETDDPSTN